MARTDDIRFRLQNLEDALRRSDLKSAYFEADAIKDLAVAIKMDIRESGALRK